MNKSCNHSNGFVTETDGNFYCRFCTKRMAVKTKAEERLIKAIIKHEEANTSVERGISWDNVQNAILKVLVERKKK